MPYFRRYIKKKRVRHIDVYAHIFSRLGSLGVRESIARLPGSVSSSRLALYRVRSLLCASLSLTALTRIVMDDQVAGVYQCSTKMNRSKGSLPYVMHACLCFPRLGTFPFNRSSSHV